MSTPSSEQMAQFNQLLEIVKPSESFTCSLSIETFMDTLIAVYHDCKKIKAAQDSCIGEFVKKCNNVEKKKRRKKNKKQKTKNKKQKQKQKQKPKKKTNTKKQKQKRNKIKY